MRQEDINDLLSNRPGSQFTDKAITAMKKLQNGWRMTGQEINISVKTGTGK